MGDTGDTLGFGVILLLGVLLLLLLLELLSVEVLLVVFLDLLFIFSPLRLFLLFLFLLFTRLLFCAEEAVVDAIAVVDVGGVVAVVVLSVGVVVL